MSKRNLPVRAEGGAYAAQVIAYMPKMATDKPNIWSGLPTFVLVLSLQDVCAVAALPSASLPSSLNMIDSMVAVIPK